MDHIGARELRANLAATVRQAGAGERVIITIDGRPVAQLGPIEANGAPSLPDLAAAGLMDAPHSPHRPAPPRPVDTAVDVRLERVLREVRGG
jgi:prevent-host-death family protein